MCVTTGIPLISAKLIFHCFLPLRVGGLEWWIRIIVTVLIRTFSLPAIYIIH